MRYLYIFLLAGFLFISCNKKQNETKPVVTDKVLTVDDLINENFSYKTGNVTVQGLCVHVCVHSGKKLFIVGKNGSDKFQVFTSEKIPAFDKKLEGSNIKVTGTLEEEKIDMAYVSNLEAELVKENKAEGKSCPTEDSMKEINDLKAKIAKSKKGYISIYTMTCSDVKTI